MNILLFLFLIILAAADISLFSNLFGQNIHPSALLCAVIIWSSRAKFERTWLMSVLAGFLADVFSWSIIGPGIFIFTLISALTGALAKRFLPPHKSQRLFIIYIFVILGTIVQFIMSGTYMRVMQFFSDNSTASLAMGNFKYLGLEIISNLVISTLIFWPISKLYPEDEKEYKIAIK